MFMEDVKSIRIALAGALGGLLAQLFGGWDAALLTLMVFMGLDYASGLVVAGVFGKSKKSQNGALESRAGFKGLCRKGAILGVVLMAHRLDVSAGTGFIRDAAVIGFTVNEALSIIENAGLMGVPIPGALIKAVDVLKGKSA